MKTFGSQYHTNPSIDVDTMDFVSIIIVLIMMSANIRIRFACRSCSYVCTLHHLIIIIVQTSLSTLNSWNACQIYFVQCVSKIKHIFRYLLYNIWGCVFSVYPFPFWWLREYTLCLIIIKSEVWTIIQCLGLGHETMVLRCMSLYVLMAEPYLVL